MRFQGAFQAMQYQADICLGLWHPCDIQKVAIRQFKSLDIKR